MNNAQARMLADVRNAWDRSGAYEMPETHRHSPGMLIVWTESRDRYGSPGDYVSTVIRLHPDGRREAITDALSASHFLRDAREEGRRI